MYCTITHVNTCKVLPVQLEILAKNKCWRMCFKQLKLKPVKLGMTVLNTWMQDL